MERVNKEKRGMNKDEKTEKKDEQRGLTAVDSDEAAEMTWRNDSRLLTSSSSLNLLQHRCDQYHRGPQLQLGMEIIRKTILIIKGCPCGKTR